MDSLEAELAQYDLGEWEDGRLKEWLPGAAEVELIAQARGWCRKARRRCTHGTDRSCPVAATVGNGE